jgi:hypothetical protein
VKGKWRQVAHQRRKGAGPHNIVANLELEKGEAGKTSLNPQHVQYVYWIDPSPFTPTRVL